MKVDTSVVPAELARDLAETGTQWATLEFGLFQEEGHPRREWTRGTWCGDTNQLDATRDDSHELVSNRDLIEQLLDDAAAAQWEKLWNAAQLSIDDAIAAAASEITDLWWTTPTQNGHIKTQVVKDILHRYFAGASR